MKDFLVLLWEDVTRSPQQEESIQSRQEITAENAIWAHKAFILAFNVTDSIVPHLLSRGALPLASPQN